MRIRPLGCGGRFVASTPCGLYSMRIASGGLAIRRLCVPGEGEIEALGSDGDGRVALVTGGALWIAGDLQTGWERAVDLPEGGAWDLEWLSRGLLVKRWEGSYTVEGARVTRLGDRHGALVAALGAQLLWAERRGRIWIQSPGELPCAHAVLDLLGAERLQSAIGLGRCAWLASSRRWWILCADGERIEGWLPVLEPRCAPIRDGCGHAGPPLLAGAGRIYEPAREAAAGRLRCKRIDARLPDLPAARQTRAWRALLPRLRVGLRGTQGASFGTWSEEGWRFSAGRALQAGVFLVWPLGRPGEASAAELDLQADLRSERASRIEEHRALLAARQRICALPRGPESRLERDAIEALLDAWRASDVRIPDTPDPGAREPQDAH